MDVYVHMYMCLFACVHEHKYSHVPTPKNDNLGKKCSTHKIMLNIIKTQPHVCRMYAAMGWLQLVGSIKLWVSFAKEPYKRDNIL